MHGVGQPVVAVTVAVGRNVQSGVGISIIVVGYCRAATSIGFAAASVLLLLVLRSRAGNWNYLEPSAHQDSRATTAVKDFMLASGKSIV